MVQGTPEPLELLVLTAKKAIDLVVRSGSLPVGGIVHNALVRHLRAYGQESPREPKSKIWSTIEATHVSLRPDLSREQFGLVSRTEIDDLQGARIGGDVMRGGVMLLQSLVESADKIQRRSHVEKTEVSSKGTGGKREKSRCVRCTVRVYSRREITREATGNGQGSSRRKMRSKFGMRRFPAWAFVLAVLACTVIAPQGASAATGCDSTIYGNDGNNNFYSFLPSSGSALTALPAVTGVANYGGNGATIGRGTKSGDLFILPLIANTMLYVVPTKPTFGGAVTQVAALTNATLVYAFGFDATGTGYALSSTESYSFLDNGTGMTTVSPLAAPSLAGGGSLTNYNSGDLAFDQSGQGYTILTTKGNGNASFLFKVTFNGTTSTVLTQVAQVTLGGANYTNGDLYDFAFGNGNIAYVTSNTGQLLYSISTATGALTQVGTMQSAGLVDLASCPFFPVPNPSVLKTGPTSAAPGDLVQYTIKTANDPAANAAAINVTLTDTVPTGVTIASTSCVGAGGVTCPAPTVSGQNVSDTIASIPAGGSAVLTIYGRNTGLAAGAMITNTANFTAQNATNSLSSTTVTTVGNTINKTVANVTQGTAATATADAGKPGDVLQYALSYGNVTGGPISKFAFSDVVPANTTYVAASATCPTIPTGFTCAITQPTAGNGQTVTFTYTPTAAGNTVPFETAVPAPTQIAATFQVKIN